MKHTQQTETGEGNAPRGYDTPADLAMRSKAVFVRSLDGYVIGEEDYKALLSEAQFQTDRVIKLEARCDELLAALKDATKLIEDCEKNVDYYICDEALTRRESLEAAIAKAERSAQ